MIHLLLALLTSTIVSDVRTAATAGDFQRAERLVREHQKQQGMTPESIEAYSWLARAALAAGKLNEAEHYAGETKKMVLSKANTRNLDRESHLPTALGAAIEVRGLVMAGQDDRSGAVAYLRSELQQYRGTSIRTRIQKNLNLLNLEGKKVPALEGVTLSKKPTLLFFWAHWCPDCKQMAQVLAQVQKQYPGISVVGPTRLYGYADNGREAGPAEEKKYIAAIQQEFYGGIQGMAAPVSEENFRVFGASTTPTLALVDSTGIVRMYHPGRMTFEELRPYLQKVTGRL